MRALTTRHQPADGKSSRRREGDLGPWALDDTLPQIREKVAAGSIAGAMEFIPVPMASGGGCVAIGIALGFLFHGFVGLLGLRKIVRSHNSFRCRREWAKAVEGAGAAL